MGYSSDLTDKEWEIIEPLLPQKKKTRPPVWTKRQLIPTYLTRVTDVIEVGWRRKQQVRA